MAAASFHCRLPHSGGHLEIKIDIPDVGAISVADRQFIVSVLDKVTAFAAHVLPEAPEAAIKAEVAIEGKPIVDGKPVIREYGGRA
jgi:hypothetical protein